MDENLPVAKKVVKTPWDISTEALIAIGLSLVITMYCQHSWLKVSQFAHTLWWIGFSVINAVYLIDGYTSKKIKGSPGPADAIIVLTGPIAFYFWTSYYTLRKWYFIPREQHRKIINELKKLIETSDCAEGFDFEFDLKRDVCDVLEIITKAGLKWASLCIFKRNKRDWTCISVANSIENLRKREQVR